MVVYRSKASLCCCVAGQAAEIGTYDCVENTAFIAQVHAPESSGRQKAVSSNGLQDYCTYVSVDISFTLP